MSPSLSNRFTVLTDLENFLSQCVNKLRSSVTTPSFDPPLMQTSSSALECASAADPTIQPPRSSVPIKPLRESASISNQSGKLHCQVTLDPSRSVLGSAPYKGALLHGRREAHANKPLVRYWRQKNNHELREDRASRIRQKAEKLKSLSSPKNPVCLKCGSYGHFAYQCRNAVLCYLCNGYGHRSKWCRTVTNLPPSQTPSSPPSTLKPPDRSPISSSPPKPTVSTLPPLLPTPAPRQELQSDSMQRELAMKLPIPHFFSNPERVELEQHFCQSFLVEDTAEWGREKFANALHRKHPQFPWRVHIFDNTQYLIEAPNPNSVVGEGILHLDNTDFPVSLWDPGYLEGLKLLSVWCKIRGLPQTIWQWIDFEQLFQPYGAIVYEVALETEGLDEFRNARVRLGVCDPQLLPPSKWILYTDPTGYTSRYKITFELEKDLGPNHKWLPAKGGPPPPKGGGGGKSGSSKQGKSSKTGPAGNGGASQPGSSGHSVQKLASNGALPESKHHTVSLPANTHPPVSLPIAQPPVSKPKEKGISIQDSSPKAAHKQITRYYEGTGKKPVLVRDEDSDTDEEDLSWFFTGKTERFSPQLHGGEASCLHSLSDLAPSDIEHMAQRKTSSPVPPGFTDGSVHTASESSKSAVPPSSPLPPGQILQQLLPAGTSSSFPPMVSAPPSAFPPTYPTVHAESDESVQSIPPPNKLIEVIPVPSDSPLHSPPSPAEEQDTASSPLRSPQEYPCNTLDTQSACQQTLQVITMLMNQLVTPLFSPPPVSPIVPPHNVVLALSTPPSVSETPSRKRGFKLDSIRRSVRIKAQSDADAPILTKATAQVQARYNLRSASKGNVLINNYPYSRLTTHEVANLFRAYRISLGIDTLQTPAIIRAIRELSRADFDSLITQALESLKQQSDSYCLVLDQDDVGNLRFT